MLILLLILSLTENANPLVVTGKQRGDSCVCDVKSLMWIFPSATYEKVSNSVQKCEDDFQKLQTEVGETEAAMTQLLAKVANLTGRLRPFQYLNSKGLYNDLQLRQLREELEQLQNTIDIVHNDNPSEETKNLITEIAKSKLSVEKANKDNIFNLEAVKEKLRRLNNRVQACRSIPPEFRSTCSQRIMTKISSPVVTKLNSISKSYIVGAWGRETKQGSEEQYWLQPLTYNHRSGNFIRTYSSFSDFMASKNYKDVSVASSYSASNAIQGPGTVLYGGAVFYQCYNSRDLCRYDLNTKATVQKTLPDATYNDAIPYCYYTCLSWTDMNLSTDERGLWVIYSTKNDHGNLVVSLLDSNSLTVTHTWKTRLFKKSVTNAFMVCGVLYATRFVDTSREEVFYAFDTATGNEDNNLKLPLEKVSANVANLHYNPVDRKLYMYNDGYLLAYQAVF